MTDRDRMAQFDLGFFLSVVAIGAILLLQLLLRAGYVELEKALK
jgi:hypothetical protein